MYGYIYLTTNLINGKKYIGKKKSDRFLENEYIGSGIRLIEAEKKYGKENFNVKLLEVCDSLSELNERERFWISIYNASKSKEFYNIAEGGDGGVLWEEGKHPSLGRSRFGVNNPMFGKHHTEEYKKKSSESHRGQKSVIKGKHRINKDGVAKYVCEEELDEYLKNGWTSSFVNKENIRKRREQGLPVGMKGRRQSDYQKKRASETHKGKVLSVDVRSRVKLGLKNMSEEAKRSRATHLGDAQKNLCWVVREGEKPLRVHIDELNGYIEKGYRRGRK